MEIELIPDPGDDDPAARAARTALALELASGREARDESNLVPHSEAWRRAAVGDAVSHSDGLADERGFSCGAGSA